MTIRLPVTRQGQSHVVMLIGNVVRVTDDGKSFALHFSVVDDLGMPGLFVQFLSQHQG